MLTLAQALKIVGKPAFAKTASAIKAAASEEDYSFGTRESTFVSFIRGLTTGADADQMATIHKHAAFWDITDECNTAQTKLAEATKPIELKDGDYAFVSGKVRKFAAYDGDSTVQAAIAFHDNRTKFDYSNRCKIATTLLSKAHRFNQRLPDYIDTYLHKAAALGVPTAESLADAMILREQAAPGAEGIEKISEVLQLMQDDPALRYDLAFVKEALSALDDFDRANTISVGLPEEVIVATEPELAKLAASRMTVILSNGKEINAGSLTKEALFAVDPSLAGRGVSELLDILPTLPKPDADLLVRLA